MIVCLRNGAVEEENWGWREMEWNEEKCVENVEDWFHLLPSASDTIVINILFPWKQEIDAIFWVFCTSLWPCIIRIKQTHHLLTLTEKICATQKRRRTQRVIEEWIHTRSKTAKKQTEETKEKLYRHSTNWSFVCGDLMHHLLTVH